MTRFDGQPRVRRNRWDGLDVPALGAWTPSLSVSVVIPAYDAGRLLPVVLAGLAAQTYPAHLLEVLVVHDGPGEPGSLALPEVRPERTRLVEVAEHDDGRDGPRGWGRANACHTGALLAEGDVVHWLDADMLCEREQVEAQLRWHHVVDYAVVLGHKWFVDPAPVLSLGPDAVRDGVAAGRVAGWFADQEPVGHTWVEEVYARTDDLRRAGPFALRTHTGAVASVGRDLYLDSGGMDPTLRLGEDIALGHRLAEAGACFVPDHDARSWHLGPTHVMSRREQVNAYNDPHLADRAPVLRSKRRPGRTYAVPYLDVVLDARGSDAAAVSACVDAVLASSLTDLRVTLLGDWSRLGEQRMAVLDDPSLDARVLRATYAGDARVRLLEEAPTTRSDTPFVLTLPGPAWAPAPEALERLLLQVEHTHDGRRVVELGEGAPAVLERTSARARARRVAEPGESLDDVVEALWGGAVVAGADVGFAPGAEVRPPAYAQTGGTPSNPAKAWERVATYFARHRGG